MTNQPASGNSRPLPEIADLYDISLQVCDGFDVIEKTFLDDPGGGPVTSLCAAFGKLAEQLAMDLETLTNHEARK